ncbi:50S ribosomal protein L13, chloroplastic [Cynara cardunculus var. scolymus]|uniref:50S ribosomal protein L13, chloroplastic n=1 Tax=Cynara cardunculus var. scolymus TaxID=59895 RepID=UPI000D62A303|nr:50S ribosomal protein L13, chloroplastic [Cynara cardunculus var. scolymus]
MAMAYATSSSVMFASSPSSLNNNNNNRSPVLFGFSTMAASASSPKNIVGARTNRNFQIRCEDQKVQQRAFAPVEQRWMFTDSDFTGPDVWNKTWYPKAEDHVNTAKTWYVVDATDKILGRLASTIAIHIRGKNLPTYTPSVDMGAFVIVVNAEKVAVSGKKRSQKLYRRHSGRPGGMTVETFDQLQQRIPERIIEHAVRGMLPKGRLGRDLFTHLKVYVGPDHPHQAQMPMDLPIRDKRIQRQT